MGTPFLTALHNPGNAATNTGSGVATVHARCAMHTGQALWGPNICQTLLSQVKLAVYKNKFGEEREVFWNPCTRAHSNHATPLNTLL